MIDAQGIADAVNRETGDLVSARMVREYVRLGIVAKALHPGRNGFDTEAIAQMVRARAAVRSGVSLQSLVGTAISRGPVARLSVGKARLDGRSLKTWFWVGPTSHRLAIQFPATLTPEEVQALSADIRVAIDRWGRKHRGRPQSQVSSGQPGVDSK